MHLPKPISTAWLDAGFGARTLHEPFVRADVETRLLALGLPSARTRRVLAVDANRAGSPADCQPREESTGLEPLKPYQQIYT